MENLFGYLAGVCTTIAFLPQVILIIKTNDTKSISLGMYSLFSFGVSMWLVYGIIKNDTAMIFANFITFILAGIVLSFKIKNFHSDKNK